MALVEGPPTSPDLPDSPVAMKDVMGLSSSLSLPCSTTGLLFHKGEIKLNLAVPHSSISFLEPLKNAFLASSDTFPSHLVLSLAFIEFLHHQQSIPPSIFETVLQTFDSEFLEKYDIHSVVTESIPEPEERRRMLGIYYRAAEASGRLGAEDNGTKNQNQSAFLRHVESNEYQVMAVFGGQGDSSQTCVKELADLYTTYKPMLRRFFSVIAPQLYELSAQEEFKLFYKGHKLDLATWIDNSASMPDIGFISRAPVSVPIIGALSLARYCVMCQILGLTPGGLRSYLQATTGHSQGLLVSIAIAISDSWDTFYQNSLKVVEVLFHLGWHCHQAAPHSVTSVIEANKEGHQNEPSYMLSVRGLKKEDIVRIIRQINSGLQKGQKIHLSLINAHDQFVLAGPIASLQHLESYLNSISSHGEDQTRIPFSKRKANIQQHFIPISAPFHSEYLSGAARSLKKRYKDYIIFPHELMIPVYHTHTGQDLRLETRNVLPIVLDAIVCECCNWPSALAGQLHMSHPTVAPSHIIVFDRGGLGTLVNKIKEGSGIRITQWDDLDPRDSTMGTLCDLVSPTLLETSTRLLSWGERFQLRLTAGEGLRLETRLSQLLGTSPIIVAGMTPTTVHTDFVAAVMNAGYHIELAGGGYYDPSKMAAAIQELARNIPPGRGITCNLIYANPRAMLWQIPLLRRLSHGGIPIDGLTIGAGVPSLEVAREYIQTLGLRHIGFKPGSVSAIHQVVEIAKMNPQFPIILQWTGGRGGGHHSFEDFHQPILATYGLIRKQSNIYLVAGSGFGNGRSIYPYLSGSWSLQMGYPSMPFDGALLGSRMMVAKEAHTSMAVKKIITNTPGVLDRDWEISYSGSAGGVMTVKSEMGEPIHKIATRGVRLWADMDTLVFNLSPDSRMKYIARNRDTIISRLNSDFAKPWFGQNIHGQVVNLEEMSYFDVLNRIIQLMYVHHQKRWIDKSYTEFAITISTRWEERLPSIAKYEAEFSNSLLLDAPDHFLTAFAKTFPTACDDLLNPEDIAFFLMQCKDPGYKPVNFIPALNEDFEFYFKKDSLWQAEDIDAVVGKDADRVCILHGPVAAQYSLRNDESAKDILGSIETEIMHCMQQEFSIDKLTNSSDSGLVTPTSWSTASITGKDILEELMTTSFTTLSESTENFSISSKGAIVLSPYRSFPLWARAFLGDGILLRNGMRLKNPFFQFLQNFSNAVVQLELERSEIFISEPTETKRGSSMKISCLDGSSICVEIQPPKASDPLRLSYRFNSCCTTSGLVEITEKRDEVIKSFYSKLWFGQDINSNISIEDTFFGPQVTLTRELFDEFSTVVGSAFPDHRDMRQDSLILPISVGIIIAWEAIARPLCINALEGDLLRLVHRSNTFEYYDGVAPLQLGDVLNSFSKVQAVYIEDSGKFVVIEAQILRLGDPVMIVTSTFLFRSSSTEQQQVATFQRTREPRMNIVIGSRLEESILLSREWFHPVERLVSLVGKSVSFSIETETRHWEDGLKTISVVGTASSQLQGIQQQVGIIEFRCEGCIENPVLEFIQRKGKLSRTQMDFENLGWHGPSSLEVQMPENNQAYSEVSRDFNPIHVSPIFATLADVPGTLCHGMCTFAIVEAVLERLVTHGDAGRVRRFEAKFVGMVMPLDKLIVQLQHTGMVDGRMRFTITAVQKESAEKVLEADAEVDQPATVYMFTGQGSQSKGMGMDLYANSAVAKNLWDGIDQQLYDTYGWSVLDIVRNNPQSLTIHFGGRHGRTIRQKYLSIITDVLLSDGTRTQKPVLPGLTPNSTSYTFTNPKGLLFSTQFAQPAILLFEAAAFAELRSRGCVSQGAMYAGHSLGEYGALSALSQFIPTGALAELAFYRGLVMQASVARDDQGGTTYGMVAANPRRVGKSFNEAALRCLVCAVAHSSQELLEIVNFNVDGEQYVCSGTTVNLYVFGELIDHLAISPEGPRLTEEFVRCANTTITDELQTLIGDFINQAKALPRPIRLRRGKATIPLEGIDVPFHSTQLRSTVEKFRQCLLRPGFLIDNVDVEQLVGKYVPNLMAKPFSLDEPYIREAFDLTQSPILGEILGA